MEFGAKRPRSKTFGKDINLPKPGPARPTGAIKKAGGGLAKIKGGMSRLKGTR